MKDNEIYQRNFSALSRFDPGICEWLKKSKPDPNILYSGNLIVIKEWGQRFSYYEGMPSVEGEKALIRSLNLSSGNLTFLIGAGLGYTAKAILETMENGHILAVLEPNPHIMNLTLESFDFSEPILSRRITIVKPEKEAIEKGLSQLIGGGFINEDVNIIPDPRSINLFPNYKEWVSQVQLAFTNVTMAMAGDTKVAKYTTLNEIQNIVQLALSPGLEKLKAALKGNPMLIIGAGPSLEESIEGIRRLKGKIVLLAVNASLRKLLFHGIRPDLVVASDKNIESIPTLKYTKHAHQIPLICSSRVHPDLLKQYVGPCFVVPDSGSLGSWLSKDLRKSVSLPGGFTVANFALEIANHLGGEPIILTGIDFSYSDYSHSEGHPMRQRVECDSILLPAEGVRGKQVKTMPAWCAIRDALELQIKGIGKQVINATNHGIRIAGTEELSLEKIGKKFFERLPPLVTSFIESSAIYGDYVRMLIPKLSTFIHEIRDSQNHCRVGLDLSRRLEQCIRLEGGDREAFLSEINHHTSAIETLMSRYPFLKHYMGELMYQSKINNAKIAREKDEWVRLEKEVDKNRHALATFQEETEGLLKAVEKALCGLEELMDVLSKIEKSGGESLTSELGSFMLRNHFYQGAGRQAKEILTMEEDSIDALYLLCQIKMKECRYAEALGLLERARKIHGGSSDGQDILAGIERGINELERQKEEATINKDEIDIELLSKEIVHASTVSSV